MISVIIPMINEEAVIEETLQHLAEQNGSCETIVVDGGSSDRSVEKARPYGQVFTAEKGRALQMNRGGREAKGNLLLFLHADSRLEKGTLSAIEEVMEKRREVVGGCLTQKIESPHPFYRFLEASGTVRAKTVRLFYGDQGLFIRKTIFDKLGGYPPVPLFEDVAFSRRLKGEGKTVVLSKRVFTSARRWEKRGRLRGSFRNLALLFCYGIGIAPKHLVRYYPDIRK